MLCLAAPLTIQLSARALGRQQRMAGVILTYIEVQYTFFSLMDLALKGN